MNIKSTSVFERNWESDKKITINRWWTRSSKTFSLLQMILVRLMTGKIDNNKVFNAWVCSIVRKYSSTIDKSIMRDWENLISQYEFSFLLSEKHRNKSLKTYSYNGRIVEFMWADDEQKIRWSKRDILYCNEVNELRYKEEFFQLMIRTSYKIFMDFNPDNEDIWINTELEQKRQFDDKDVNVIVSTYKDNPFLENTIIKEIERLQNVDLAYWRIYWLGEYGKLEWLVFDKWTEIWDIPLWAKLLCRGLDFWFTCLVWETLIETINGSKRIDQIKEWDLVLTRKWYKKVLRQWSRWYKNVYRLNFWLWNRIISTWNHKFFTQDWWKEAHYLSNKETICHMKKLSLNEEHINAKIVDWIFFKQAIIQEKYALENVRILCHQLNEKREVFDITVEWQPEFFANWILVHNCDPTALVDLYRFENSIILDQRIYKHWLTNQDIIKEFNNLWLEKWVEIFADSSEPKSIEEIYRWGYNIKSVVKWADSIRYWINTMKSYNILITSRSKDWIREIKWYTRMKDKNWKSIDKPIDENNHCFIWDTNITTDKWLVKIKDIKEWDLVLTRKWYKKVLIKHNNGLKQINKYQLQLDTELLYLCCTDNHLIYTTQWWIQISQLQSGQIINIHKNSIEKNLQQINIEKIEVIYTYNEEVYDLTVEDEHEYFANWILVHNCLDASRYASMMKLWQKTRSVWVYSL